MSIEVHIFNNAVFFTGFDTVKICDSAVSAECIVRVRDEERKMNAGRESFGSRNPTYCVFEAQGVKKDNIIVVRLDRTMSEPTWVKLKDSPELIPDEIPHETYQLLDKSISAFYVKKDPPPKEVQIDDIEFFHHDRDLILDVLSNNGNALVTVPQTKEALYRLQADDKSIYSIDGRVLSYFYKRITADDKWVSVTKDDLDNRYEPLQSIRINYHKEPWVVRQKQVPKLTKNLRPYLDGRTRTVFSGPNISDTVILYASPKNLHKHNRSLTAPAFDISRMVEIELEDTLEDVLRKIDDLFEVVTFGKVSKQM